MLVSGWAGRRFRGSAGLVLAMCVGSVLVAPVAVISGGRALLKPAVLGAGLVIGLLSSVIPYRFELETLRRGPARGFCSWVGLGASGAAPGWVGACSPGPSVPRQVSTCCACVA